MSRSVAPNDTRPRQKARRHGLPFSWHAVCICLVSGCYYIEPVKQPPQNNAPAIQTINPPDNIVVFNQSIKRVTVLAVDPDGDDLFFDWIPPIGADWGEVTAQGPSGAYRSDLTITADPVLDGETLLLSITDGAAGAPGVTRVAWLLEVP